MDSTDQSQSQVILCTGANRSLGFAILQATASRLPNATYILACRSITAGEAAAKELRLLGISSNVEALELDVTNDAQILAAFKSITAKHGKLDVLINNAGIATIPKEPDLSDFRAAYNATYSVNVTSVAFITTAFKPLLQKSLHPRVINISSARGSLTRSTAGKLPPTAAVAYSVSKTALNALTIEFQKSEVAEGGKINFYVASPGHLKTAFNGFRGTTDPLVGAEVVARLVTARVGQFEGGSFWEFADNEMRAVPW